MMSRQPQDAEARAIAMFGMWPVGENFLAQKRHRWPQPSGFVEQPLGGPVRIAPMAGGHVVSDAGVAAVARPAQMGGDTLALQEHLDGAGGQTHLDRGTGWRYGTE